MNKQRGFSVVEAAVGFAVIALLGFLAYSYMFHGDDNVGQAPSSEQRSAMPEAPEINSVNDLDETAAVLDSIDLEADNAELSALEADLAEL